VSLLFTLLVGLFILLGSILGNFFRKNKKFIDLAVGLAVGVMVLLLILDIVPESYELLSDSCNRLGIVVLLLGTIVGFILLKLLDRFVPHHEHEAHHHHHHSDDKCHNEHLQHVGILASIAVIIHNIIEGMTLYVTSLSDTKSGMLLMLAIGLHNIPLGIIISSTLQSKKEVIINSIVLSLSTFVGGIIALLISSSLPVLVEGLLLSITVGMIIYIVFDELLPQVIHSEDKKHSILGIIIGIIILLISTLLG